MSDEIKKQIAIPRVTGELVKVNVPEWVRYVTTNGAGLIEGWERMPEAHESILGKGVIYGHSSDNVKNMVRGRVTIIGFMSSAWMMDLESPEPPYGAGFRNLTSEEENG